MSIRQTLNYMNIINKKESEKLVSIWSLRLIPGMKELTIN